MRSHRPLAEAYRDFVRKHPGIYAETLSATQDDREIDAVAEKIIGVCSAVMAGYQLRSREAIHALRALRSVGHGFASLEAARGFGIPVNIDESYHWLIENFIAGLEATQIRSRPVMQRAKVARAKTISGR